MIDNKVYLDVAANWNHEDKKVIAERNGVGIAAVSSIAKYIAKKTGLPMRKQSNGVVSRYTPEFIEELKKVHRP